jgi:cyanophycin synthetase
VEGGAEPGPITVIVDLAHNEAGLDALMDVAHGLKAPGAQVLLGLGLAGDRTDEILQRIGELAAVRADRIVAAHKERYLRGRTREELERHLRIGLARAGIADIDSYDTELSGLQALVDAASAGDVVALMCHAERQEVTGWLTGRGAAPDTADDIRRKVVAARGEHEFEQLLDELWHQEDAAARVAGLAALAQRRPGDPRLAYEHAGALDAAGDTSAAIPLYRAALDAGLREPHRHRARIQLASSLRVEGKPDEALALLEGLSRERPTSAAVAAFRALALCDVGQPAEAVSSLIESLLAHAPEADAQAYRRALTAYAQELREHEARSAG